MVGLGPGCLDSKKILYQRDCYLEVPRFESQNHQPKGSIHQKLTFTEGYPP